MAAETIVPFVPAVTTGSGPCGEPGAALRARDPMADRTARDDLRWYLMNRYRALLVDRLTVEDFEDLRRCLGLRFRPDPGRDRECLHRFVLKVQEYIPDAILRREIVGIGTLITLMRPEDLPAQAGRQGIPGSTALPGTQAGPYPALTQTGAGISGTER